MSDRDAGPATLIVLHGHDDDPEATLEVARIGVGSGCDVVAPAGPVRTGGNRRAWWRSDDDGAPVGTDVAAAVDLVDDVVRRHGDHAPVLLGGFSQGGALALALALRAAPPGEVERAVAGAFAVGAWLPDLVGVETDLSPAATRPLPILIAHGSEDEAVPLLLGRSAARLLHRAGVPITFVELEVGHSMAPFVGALHDWAAAVRNGEVPANPP